MRPSGRKASRHGRLKVVTVVIVKGRLGSGFCSPTFTCAQAAADASMKSKPLANFIFISLDRSFWHCNRHGLAGPAFRDPDRVARGLDCRWCLEPFLDYRDAGLITMDRNHRDLAAAILGEKQ